MLKSYALTMKVSTLFRLILPIHIEAVRSRGLHGLSDLGGEQFFETGSREIGVTK
jgi:hypothetical protein